MRKTTSISATTENMIIIKINKKGQFNLNQLKDIIDVNQVKFYTNKKTTNGNIVLSFYDKSEKKIRLKPQK